MKFIVSSLHFLTLLLTFFSYKSCLATESFGIEHHLKKFSIYSIYYHDNIDETPISHVHRHRHSKDGTEHDHHHEHSDLTHSEQINLASGAIFDVDHLFLFESRVGGIEKLLSLRQYHSRLLRPPIS